MRFRLMTYLIFMIIGGVLTFFALTRWLAPSERGDDGLSAVQTQQARRVDAAIRSDVVISEEACAEARRQPLGRLANAKNLDLSNSAAVEAQLVELMDTLMQDAETRTYLTCVLTDMTDQR